MAEIRQVSIADKQSPRVAHAQEVGAPAGASALDALAEPGTTNILPGQHLARIRVELISPTPDGQARKDFDEGRLQVLADSLKRSGVREPIIVTPHGTAPGRFEIVAGERRWRAAQLAGLAEIPCIVDPKLVERRDKLLVQAEENLHRENLNAVEEARVLAQLMDARKIDVRAAGELMGRSYIQARRLARIHSAIEPIKRALSRGDLDARAAVDLIRIYNTLAKSDTSVGLSETANRVEKLIDRIVRERWSARRIEQYATKLGAGAEGPEDGESLAPATPPGAASHGPEVAQQAATCAPAAGAPVASAHDAHGLSTPRPLFTRADGRVVIEERRLERGQVTPDEREQLIGILEELLLRVRRT